jgi:hypothetical protein
MAEWQWRLAVNQEIAGSIPAPSANLGPRSLKSEITGSIGHSCEYGAPSTRVIMGLEKDFVRVVYRRAQLVVAQLEWVRSPTPHPN